MSVDKRVPARSDVEIRSIAERTKAEFGVSRRRPVNILRCLESGSVLTLYGRKKLVFAVVEDAELPDVDAKTEFSKGIVTITSRRSVHDRARMGVGRDRMTLAHELAHAVLHHSVPMFRLVGAAGATDLAQDGAHTSAEHQAKVLPLRSSSTTKTLPKWAARRKSLSSSELASVPRKYVSTASQGRRNDNGPGSASERPQTKQ